MLINTKIDSSRTESGCPRLDQWNLKNFRWKSLCSFRGFGALAGCLFSLGLGIPSGLARAEGQGLHLRDVVAFACSHAPRLRAAEEETLAAKLATENAAAQRLPSLDFLASQGLQKTLPTPVQPSPHAPLMSRVQLALTQPIYDNGVTSIKLQTATLQEQAAQLNFERVRADLVLSVAKSFYKLSLSSILLTIKSEQLALIQKQFELMDAAFKQGLRTKKDHLRIQAERDRSAIALQEGRAEAELLSSHLKSMMGGGEAEQIDFALPTAQDVMDQPLPEVPSTVDPKRTYEFREAEIQEQIAVENLRLAEKKYFPEWSLGASASYDNSDYLRRPNVASEPLYATDSLSWNLTLGVKYNLWDNGSRRREAEIEATRARSQKLGNEAKLSELTGTLGGLNLKLAALRASLVLKKKLMAHEELSYAHLDGEYRQGRVAYIDMVSGLSDLLAAKIDYFSTHAAWIEALADYRFFEGSIYETLARP